MAIQNNPYLYSFGNVKLDSSPSVNFYGQLLARKKAKEEAIDEYYRKLPGTINAAGMRDQSIPGFNAAVSQAQAYWMQNKDQIRKGTTPEAYNYDKMLREIRGKVQQDKNAAKTDLEIGKMRFNKENSYIFDDPSFVKTQSQHALSVFDPNYKPMDLGTLTLPPKPYDTDEQGKAWKFAVGDAVAGKKYDYSKQYTNPQTGQVVVPTLDIYRDDQIKGIAERMAQYVTANKGAQLHYQKILDNPTAETWKPLQEAYQKYFPGDMVDTPEKAAAAEAIIRANVPKKYAEEQESNYQQKQLDALKRLYFQNALILGRQRIGGENYGAVSGNAFDDLADNKFKNFDIVGGVFYNKDGTPKSGTVFISGQHIPATVKSALKSGGIDPDLLISGVDAVIENGKIKSISNQGIGTITRGAMEGVYQRKMDTERKNEPKLEFSGNKGGGQNPTTTKPIQNTLNATKRRKGK